MVFSEISDCKETACVANVDSVCVTNVEEALFEKFTGSVRDHAVAFHFPEAKPSIAASSFHGLSGEHLHGSPGSTVDLVLDHVFEAMIVGWSEEDLSGDFEPGVSVEHDFVALFLESEFM